MINNVVEVITNLKKMSWDELSLDAQVSIVFASCRNQFKSIKWWTEKAEDINATEATKDAAAKATREMSTSLSTMLPFLQRAAEYEEASILDIVHDMSSTDINDGSTVDDYTDASATAIKDKPYKWAKESLIKSGDWELIDVRTPKQKRENIPEIMEPKQYKDKATLIILDRDTVANRIASGLACKIMLNQTKSRFNKLARDLEISCLSPMVWNILTANESLQTRRVFELAKFSPPYVNNKFMLAKEVVQIWEELVEMDFDDQQKRNIKSDTRQLKRTIADASRAAVMMATLTSGLAAMTKAGVSPEVMALIAAQAMAPATATA
jgi:hypothetical protein